MHNASQKIAELRLLAKTVGISTEEEALMRSLAEIKPVVRRMPTAKADDVKVSFPRHLLNFLLPS